MTEQLEPGREFDAVMELNELGGALLARLKGYGVLWLNVYHCEEEPVAKRAVLDGFPLPDFVCPACGQQPARDELLYDWTLVPVEAK